MKIIKNIVRLTAVLSPIILPVTAMADADAATSSITAQLTQRYQSTATHCGGSQLPAYLCSGIILRGTAPSENFTPWSPSPESVKSGGVSFAYLRRDAKFSKMPLGYKNGYILYAPMKAPRQSYKPSVLCLFPINAQSNGRAMKGCGEHLKYPSYSRPCQMQRIFSASQWYRHFRSAFWSPQAHQCGFLMKQSDSNSARTFSEFIKARNMTSSSAFHVNNEFRIAVWPTEQSDNLPIQAFFYIDGGLHAAQHDQSTLKQITGRFVPIVKIILPTQPRDNARFLYSSKDQN